MSKMRKQNSIKKNFTYQMIYEVLVIILPFITSPYIARVIGPEGLGTYSYSYSVAYYFVLVSLLGLKNYGNRAIAQVRDNPKELNDTFSNIVAVHILISLVCVIFYTIYILILSEGREYAAIQMLYVLSGLFDISWFYFGIERFKLTVTRNTIIKIVNVICVFSFVKTEADLWKYCLIMALGQLISQLTLWIPLKKYLSIVRPRWCRMRIHLKPLFILFIPAVAVSLYKYMDKIMIGLMSSKTQLGFYENAEKVINIPMTVIASFGTVMLPKMSNLAVSDNQKLAQHYIELSMQFVMCLAFALAFGLAGVSNVFAPVFWGEEFELSGTIIMELAITIPFVSFANVIRTQYLIPNKKDKEYVFSVTIGAAINLVINSFLIPAYGALGATIGTVSAEVAVCFVQSFLSRRILPLKKYVKSFIWFSILGCIMFLLVYVIGICLGVRGTTLIIQISLGGIFYLLGSSIYFYITKNEVFIKMFFSKKV